MLTKNDKLEIRGIFTEVLSKNNEHIFQMMRDFKREIRDEVHSLIFASESRMMQRMDAKLEKLRTDIVNDIGSILDEAVLPQIAELQHDVKRVKLHLHMA